MRMLFGAASAAVLSTVVAAAISAPAQARPASWAFVSGNWQGKAYYGRDGRFTQCIMWARYRNGDLLMFAVRRNASMTIGVGNTNWNLMRGKTAPINVYVDGILVRQTVGMAIDQRIFAVPFRSNKVVFALLRKGRNLTMQTPKGRSSYSLQGTNAALVKLVTCAVRAMRSERRGSESIFQ